jgi:hypothetical protein
MKHLARLIAPLCLVASALAADLESKNWRHEELRRFVAKEANQGVAADAQFLYVISNSAIGKYRKDTLERVGGWKSEKGGPIIHMNAGLVRDGRLYCAHSNFPAVPMVSSVEIFETATMQHVGSHSLGIGEGSLTWIISQDDHWLACFAQYAVSRAKTGRDNTWTQIVKFDDHWRRVAGWVFPAELIERFAGNSSSGGAFGPGGKLYVTGHTAQEIYVLEFPEAGSVLKWTDTIPISAEGQSFAWDPVKPEIFYSINKRTSEVIVSRIVPVSELSTAQAAASAIFVDNSQPDAGRAVFESLFDGQTLAGWEHKGNWVVEDGAMFRKDKGGSITWKVKKVPDDFELRFEWKVSKGCNSGVYYRPGQVEYQVLDNANSPYGENPRQSAGSLFFCMAPAKDMSKPFGEWNEGRVVCKGAVIQHWLNGEKVIDFDYTDPKWKEEVELLRIRGGNLAGRGGSLWLQDHGEPVWFRNIRLRTIPPDEQIERSDFMPMPIPPAALEKENARVQQMLKKEEK